MERENALDAGAEADAADGEGGAGGAALLGNHNAFERLNAFLDLFAFAFEEADIDADGIARTELGEVFAQLRVMKLTNYGVHVRYSLQTHSGGASSSQTNCNYTGKRGDCLAGFGAVSASLRARFTLTDDPDLCVFLEKLVVKGVLETECDIIGPDTL